MRVLVVTHYYPEHRSGVEIIAGELVRRLVQRGIEVTWAASDEGIGSDTEGAARAPMRVCNVSERRFGVPYPLWGPVSLLRLGHAVRRCDLVHLHDALYMGNVMAYLWARALGKPVAVTQHVGPIPYSNRLLRGLLAVANRTVGRLVLGGADLPVFYSPRVHGYFTRLFRLREPAQFISNGVDTASFFPVSEATRRRLREELGWPSGQPVFLFVGRFVEKKGLALLRELAERLTGCDWVFVGWGPDDPGRWGLPNVRCLGQLPQRAIARFYQAADLLVLPSVGEGFPLVVQEAMACGLPPVITEETAGGAPAVAKLVYTLPNDRAAWLGELARLAAAPAELDERRGRIAAFAREHWDWERAADAYAEAFRSVTENGVARRLHPVSA
jgi:glycosyltransferase involved in cell wall biosynthesis